MTSDDTTSVGELRRKVQKFIEDRDWSKYHNPKDLAISISIEASELMELFQWVKEEEMAKTLDDPGKFAKLEEELADIVIYCLSLANVLDINVAQTVSKKIEKNDSKYPVQEVKGVYRKYTELGQERSTANLTDTVSKTPHLPSSSA